ncbi:Fungal specific transcription factor domain [Ceratobasidium sp. AG-Ba]|nr:Fungal specific transcription factor domain [Ceratobasidium sp. AG-Ba]
MTTQGSPGLFTDSDSTPPSAYSDVPNGSSLPRVSLFSPQQTSSDLPDDSNTTAQGRQLQFLVKASTSQPDSMYSLNARTLSLLLSRPSNLSWAPADVIDMTSFFMDRFQRMASLSFFKPTYLQLTRIHNVITWRLRYLPSTRWAVFMCTKLFDSILSGVPLTPAENELIRQAMSRIEELLYSTPTKYLTPAELQHQLSGSLELALFRLRAEGTDTYELLRNYAPTFLQLIFSDATLWPSNPQSTAVSLAHVLESNSYEVCHFAMLDLMCAMAYGLPQMMEYDTTTPPVESGVHPAELVHGCPPAMQFILADINKLCSWNLIGPIANWRTVEQRLLDWQPNLRPPTDEEDSWKGVARLAVQESWRHTLLVYLYMAVCGASSDEPKVATSVRQIFRIMSTVKYEQQPIADAHFFMQYLIGGAFTPNEKHRALARSKLSDGFANKFWLLGVDRFVPVLDHLWHGAAGNGQAIQWSDYLHSRQTMMPISA